MALRARKNKNGSRKAVPMVRPSIRWLYSNQKIDLKSARDMPWLIFWYSGKA